MEAVFMSAGILTAIILCVVGLVKLPFDKFKEKSPKWYKATFTLVALILTVVLCILDQLFVLNLGLNTVEFAVLLLSTIAGVFGLYNAYEGLGAKELVKRLLTALQNLKASATPESKLAKSVEKLKQQAEKCGVNIEVICNAIEQATVEQPKKDEDKIQENVVVNSPTIINTNQQTPLN